MAVASARHILVDSEAQCLDLKTKIEQGEDFAELAKEYSEDPGSALRGGELGWSDPENYTPAFKEALAQLEPGEFSEPVRSTFGWHLIQLIDRRMDDATDKRKEDKAYQLIFNRKFAEETENWLREMRDAAYVEVVES